jgi:hypothetical protein
MRRTRAIVISLALTLACQVSLGVAATISDPLLDPLCDYPVQSVAQYLSKSLHGSIEVEALRGSLFGSPLLQQWPPARDGAGPRGPRPGIGNPPEVPNPGMGVGQRRR